MPKRAEVAAALMLQCTVLRGTTEWNEEDSDRWGDAIGVPPTHDRAERARVTTAALVVC